MKKIILTCFLVNCHAFAGIVERSPSVVEELPNTPVIMAEYILTYNYEMEHSSAQLFKRYEQPWFIDMRVDSTSVVRDELVEHLGKPRSVNGVWIWETDNLIYLLGERDSIRVLNLRASSVGKEIRKPVSNLPGNATLRVVRNDTENLTGPVRAINTERLTNRGMPNRAGRAEPAPTSSGGLLDRITGGDYTGCPPGRVWVGPRTTPEGAYVAGRCVDPESL